MRNLFIFFITIICLAATLWWLTLGRGHNPLPLDEQELAYYRAVYVLQQLDTPANANPIAVPAYIKRHDTTESYLHHSDKTFILRTIATDLDEVAARFPDAPLYQSYALFALGNYKATAQVLSSYVVTAPFSNQAYSTLCQSLKYTNDTTFQYLIALEWQERDPTTCLEERITCIWSALFNAGRFADAEAYMQAQHHCLGWKAQIYIAKARLAQGNIEAAEAVIAAIRQENSADATKILQVWERNKMITHY